MKTPYDGALRVQQVEVDDVRAAISIQINQLVHVENSRAAVDDALAREAALMAGDPHLSSSAYLARMRAERTRLTHDQAAIDARLGQLRSRAVAAYSSFKAIESAAQSFREEAERTLDKAEQARIDDASAASLGRNRFAARRSHAR